MKDISEEELRRRLGEYVAPQGLYGRTTAMSFLGKVHCDVRSLVAGSWHEIVLDYEVGSSGLADGAWMKVTFKFYSDWALFQTTQPGAANYVSAEYQAGPCVPGQSPATVQSLKVRFDQKGHERPFQKAIIVDVVDGYLKAGDHIIIRLGDKRQGGPGTRVQTFVEQGFRFRCYIDCLGTSRFSAIPGDIVLDVIPGAPRRVVFAMPRLMRTGEQAQGRVRIEDEWGNTCRDLGARVRLAIEGCRQPATEQFVSLPERGWATAAVRIPSAHAGELAIAGFLEGHAVTSGLTWVTLDPGLSTPRPFFGDLHVHSDDTVGTNDTTYNLTYGRDVAGLDVLGYTANDFQITRARWQKAVAVIRELNQDGSFVCYPGTEWCGNSCAGGDHNVVFLHDREPEFPFDRDGNVCRSFEWNEDMAGDHIEPGAWPIEHLYATYAHDPEGHLLMPHVGGRRCNLDWHHPALERLVEVGSAWGQFPWLYEDAIGRGYKLGVSANGDEHRGRCGGGVPGAAVFGTRGGLTGILAPELTRVSVGQALRARHTFATTGERLVALLSSGSHMQGDEWQQKGPAVLQYRFLGDAGWDEIAAFDHDGCFWRRDLQQEHGHSARRIRFRWGGARIRDRYRWAAWRGTITVVGATVDGFSGRGFEHPEESCWRDGPNRIGFHSDTYGDADTIEMELSDLAHCVLEVRGRIDGYVKVGDPLAGNPFVHCPEFSWTVTGSELIHAGGRMQRTLGGAELFLAFERMADVEMPREVRGEFELAPVNGPHGFRPVFLLGRQVDDSKAWTSALFVNFL
ncbi:MAG TPA: DUF3604 domain-containing protein [Acidiferrobacteraceae bacterium]|nr:DUF3604 domain-containing protein [Acidiferrobacteraceae bacterium]